MVVCGDVFFLLPIHDSSIAVKADGKSCRWYLCSKQGLSKVSDDVSNVAAVSAGDPEIGQIIAKVVDTVGRDGCHYRR